MATDGKDGFSPRFGERHENSRGTADPASGQKRIQEAQERVPRKINATNLLLAAMAAALIAGAIALAMAAIAKN